MPLEGTPCVVMTPYVYRAGLLGVVLLYDPACACSCFFGVLCVRRYIS
tara:strand:+ start:470 stop:613 length:144 start_codon:yes stop_codon:yes gene_type:complete